MRFHQIWSLGPGTDNGLVINRHRGQTPSKPWEVKAPPLSDIRWTGTP
jgi:hypothetical protein